MNKITQDKLFARCTALTTKILEAALVQEQSQSELDEIRRALFKHEQDELRRKSRVEGYTRLAALIENREPKKLYIGKNHACRCGCAGNYHYAGTRAFKVMLTKLAVALQEGAVENTDNDKNCINFSLQNNRAITVYFTE